MEEGADFKYSSSLFLVSFSDTCGGEEEKDADIREDADGQDHHPRGGEQ